MVHMVHMAKKQETKSTTVTVRLTPRIKQGYEALAEREERTVSHLASDVLAHWLEEHHPDLIPDPPPEDKLFDPSGGVCQVPLYDVRAAAGEGNFISEENLEKQLHLTRQFILDLGTIPENLVGLRVMGDSMEPELLDGDVVLVNSHLDNGVALSEDIYVFRLDNELLIKRLMPLEDGSVRVLSTNPAYPSFDIRVEAAEGEFQVIGRLAVRWREME